MSSAAPFKILFPASFFPPTERKVAAAAAGHFSVVSVRLSSLMPNVRRAAALLKCRTDRLGSQQPAAISIIVLCQSTFQSSNPADAPRIICVRNYNIRGSPDDRGTGEVVVAVVGQDGSYLPSSVSFFGRGKRPMMNGMEDNLLE